jgi:hypothetical protein
MTRVLLNVQNDGVGGGGNSVDLLQVAPFFCALYPFVMFLKKVLLVIVAGIDRVDCRVLKSRE